MVRFSTRARVCLTLQSTCRHTNVHVCDVAWRKTSELKLFKEAVLKRFNAQESKDAVQCAQTVLCYLSAAKRSLSGPAVLSFVW